MKLRITKALKAALNMNDYMTRNLYLESELVRQHKELDYPHSGIYDIMKKLTSQRYEILDSNVKTIEI